MRLQVVVGTDGTTASDQAVTWAAHEAAHRGAALRIVHVWQPLGYLGAGLVAAPAPTVDEEQRQAARGYLDEAVRLAHKAEPGIDIDTTLVQGPAARALIEESAAAAVLVIGASHRPLLSRLAMGSVSAHVVSHAACPVVVVPPAIEGRETGRRQVVVGVDGSATSLDAVAFALDYAEERGLEVVAVEAWNSLGDGWVSAAGDQPSHARAQREISESLAGWREQHPDVVVRRESVRDDPVHALLERAETAELVVVGSHGRGAFTGMMMGSVSRSVVHQSASPVAVVRPLT